MITINELILLVGDYTLFELFLWLAGLTVLACIIVFGAWWGLGELTWKWQVKRAMKISQKMYEALEEIDL